MACVLFFLNVKPTFLVKCDIHVDEDSSDFGRR